MEILLLDTLKIIIQVVAILLCITWTYGCRQKYFYEVTLAKATVGITAIWWILLILSVSKLLNPLHLLWSYPISIILVNFIFYSPFGLPLRIIERIFLFLVTVLPTKNDSVRKLSISVLNDVCNIFENELLDKKEYNVELLTEKVIIRYKNYDKNGEAAIINEAYKGI